MHNGVQALRVGQDDLEDSCIANWEATRPSCTTGDLHLEVGPGHASSRGSCHAYILYDASWSIRPRHVLIGDWQTCVEWNLLVPLLRAIFCSSIVVRMWGPTRLRRCGSGDSIPRRTRYAGVEWAWIVWACSSLLIWAGLNHFGPSYFDRLHVEFVEFGHPKL